ncbi:hypothetical protein Agub_g13306, partial [Astrephomene gubernaculifera]
EEEVVEVEGEEEEDGEEEEGEEEGRKSGGGRSGAKAAAGGGGGRGTVERFLKALSRTLDARAPQLAASRDTRGPLSYAVRVWASTAPHLVTPRLLELAKGGGGGGGGGAGRGSAGDKTSSQLHAPPSRQQLLPGGGAGGGVALREGPNVSELQKDVYRRLGELGYRPRMEEQVGMWSVDMCLRVGGVRVAVEVDGPYHFTTSSPQVPLGSTRVRDACLRRLGLRVVALDYQRYGRLEGAQRGRLLRMLVE